MPKKGYKQTKEHKRKVIKSLTPFKKGHKVNLGKHHSEETKTKMRKPHSNFQKEKCHLWKGGISFEPYSTDWTETLKRAIRERDNYICQKCSQYGNVVHHIDYNKKNCNPNNLITLCHKCNTKVNFNREYWKQYFQNQNV